MISRELFSIRVQTNLQTMEMTSWWRNLFLSFSRFAFLRETSMGMDVMKTFNVTMNFAVEPLAKITSRSRFSEKLLILLYEQLLIFGLYLENLKLFILLLLLLLFIYSFFIYLYSFIYCQSESEEKSRAIFFLVKTNKLLHTLKLKRRIL